MLKGEKWAVAMVGEEDHRCHGGVRCPQTILGFMRLLACRTDVLVKTVAWEHTCPPIPRRADGVLPPPDTTGRGGCGGL